MSLSEHTWVLSEGEIIAEGAPAEIVADPSVVAAYLGKGMAQRMKHREAGYA
jgi:branched-chain amino acid transport system ATP-binding protein